MKKVLLLSVGALSTIVMACQSATSVVLDGTPTAFAILTGRITDEHETPLDNVRIGVGLPNGYTGGPSFTNAQGNFSVRLNRMSGNTDGSPDAVRADLVIQWISGKRADGTYPELRTTQLLTFAPSSPVPTVVSLRVATP